MLWFLVGLIIGLVIGKIGPIVMLQNIEKFFKETVFPKLKEKYSKKTEVTSSEKNDDKNTN